MKLQDRLLAAADQCVLCGICLPHCPTFQLRGQEVESPRGRIALLQAYAAGALQRTPALLEHIDNCLVCRSCEKRCPSGVRYGEIISDGRALLRADSTHTADFAERLETRLLAGDTTLAGLTRLAGRSGVARLAERSGLLGKGRLAHLGRLLPSGEMPPLPDELPARGEQRGSVALFIGCTGRLFEQAALLALAELLASCGWRVVLPSTPHCCGSRTLAHGELDKAHEQRDSAIGLFNGLITDGIDHILTLSSACGGLLAQLSRWEAASEASIRVESRVHDAVTFLLADPQFATLTFSPLHARVALHTPCSVTNLLGKGHDAGTLLKRIEGLELHPLAARYSCCGAAGDYLLDHPETAEALRAPVLEILASEPCDYLVSSNIGCALHLGEGVRGQGEQTEVLHPLTLLARCLPD